MSCFAAACADACEVVLLDSDTAFEAWRAGASRRTCSWLRNDDFRFAPGASLVVRDDVGAPETLILCFTPGDELWQFAALSATTPPADYALAQAPPGFNGEAAAFGWWRGQYCFNAYKTGQKAQPRPRLVMPDGVDGTRLEALIAASRTALDLANTPANDMGPAQLEAAALRIARQFDAQMDVIAGDDLLQQNFPLIHAVGRASAQPPRLIDLRWGPIEAPRLTLVGKGVCFDAGGLNIKTAADMLLMKTDMMGAAQALGLAQYVMAMQLKVRLRLLIPAVENTVSSDAYRPLDVLRSRSGITIEIGDTDAEGRLILADALTAAAEEKPHLIVDFATLTSAVTAALGPEVAAFFTNDEGLQQPLVRAGRAAQDPIWPLPLHRSYLEQMSEGAADLTNALQTTAARPVVAALFLEHFVGDSASWLHVDFCGWNAIRRPGRPVGAETHGLRAVAAFIEQIYRN